MDASRKLKERADDIEITNNTRCTEVMRTRLWFGVVGLGFKLLNGVEGENLCRDILGEFGSERLEIGDNTSVIVGGGVGGD